MITVSFTESNIASPVHQLAAYDCQLLILGSEHHLLTFPHHLTLHAKQTQTTSITLHCTLPEHLAINHIT